ncbi:MAG: branched-chain amino acid transporter permease [Ramlibacter sp.]|jgi:branched-chain amino acid transport system permease protein|nr:branched-chain amino acid transporter permease [Ramlibacter sp.]
MFTRPHRLLLALTLFAAAMSLPLLQLSPAMLTGASQIAIAILFALSFHLMYGICGMLWFAHGIFFGVGGYALVYLLKGFHVQSIPYVPISLLPLACGLVAALAGAAIGWIATRREKLAFAMISLGIGELAMGLGYVFRSVSGGEEGLSVDRWVGPTPLGITFGPPWQVYLLIVCWVALSMLAIRHFETTPLGRIALAARENAERLRFLAYDVRMVRWLTFTVASFFAGIAGSLSALSYEHVGLASLSIEHSALPVFMTVLGGTGSFFGTIAGAIGVTLLSTQLSGVTPAWLFYLGVIFTCVILFSPNGLAGAFAAQRALLVAGTGRRQLLRNGLVRAAAILVVATGLIGMTEVVFARRMSGGGAVSIFTLGLPLAGALLLWLLVAASGAWWGWSTLARAARTRRAAPDVTHGKMEAA